jgi:ATP-dependent Lon protease
MNDNDILSAIESIDDIKNVIPKQLPILPLRDVVIFPNMIFPVLIGREASLNAVAYVADNDKFIFLSTQKNPDVNDPGFADIHQEGTIAKVLQVLKLPNQLYKVLVEGICQAEIVAKVDNKKFLEAEVKETKQTYQKDDRELTAIMRTAGDMFADYVKRSPMLQTDIVTSYDNILDPIQRLYFAAANVRANVKDKMDLLAQRELKKQYYILTKMLGSEIELQEIELEIGEKLQDSIQTTQKKYIIQEQIRTLQKELGEEGMSPEIEELKKAVEEADMPEAALTKANEEITKLMKTPTMSPEYALGRTYIEWLSQVPWKKMSEDNFSIQKVMETLNEDHFGLKEPKDRILEYIAILNLAGNLRKQILCFAGPPGTGKTSLARSIAKALGREFVRFSLGGVRDEAEIRGHRRTYVGALPGKIVQSMKKAGTVNPVILLDEIDKMSMDFRGDPSAALLEVLDPEQNNNFQDHYLEVDYDLSNVLFITTANVKFDIPLPLIDRMEVIELNSYTKEEKLEISKRHIIPKIIKDYSMENFSIDFRDEAIAKVIEQYTKEPGVRNLERQLSAVLRKMSTEVVADYQKSLKTKSSKSLQKNRIFKKKVEEQEFVIDEKMVEKYLKAPKFKDKPEELEDMVGAVKGLAWTQVGGDVMPVEATLMPGSEKLILTGKLGDVMKESAQAALSYVRSNTEKLKVPEDFYLKKDIHIHVPEGAIPKDGPSAGITMTMAIISAAAKRPIFGDIAMTGEVTLRGQILPIGGIKEKLLAAKKNKMRLVLVPKENEGDVMNLEDGVRDGIDIVFVSSIDDALPHVFNIKTA